MPAQNPYRITNELISIFVKYNIKWLNIQINHPRELTQELLDHIRLLQKE
jgi:L-lysine 2,3-aminomutase